MAVFAAKIAYDGSKFSGFAKTKNLNGVLNHLESAFCKVGIDSSIIGAGRTDKGVHALGQVIRFENPHLLKHYSLANLTNLLNKKLYPHIQIRHLWQSNADFHPRFSAISRCYRYIFSPNLLSPFLSNYVSVESIGDKTRFTNALKCFKGTHNFYAFKKNGSFTKSDIRQIFSIAYYQSSGFHIVWIKGSGFLRAQVRLMIGASLACSRGELSLKNLQEQLHNQKLHYSYPISPNGLYLSAVGYKKEAFSHP